MFHMIVPETTGIQQRGWDMFIDAGLKVFNIFVRKV